MSKKTELFTQEVDFNEIFKLSIEDLNAATIAVYLKTSEGEEDISSRASYIGGGFIQISPVLHLNDKITVSYETLEEENLTARIRKLEQEVKTLKEVIETLNIKLNNKVDKHSFRVWIKAIENSLGEKILKSDLLGIEGQNSYE